MTFAFNLNPVTVFQARPANTIRFADNIMGGQVHHQSNRHVAAQAAYACGNDLITIHIHAPKTVPSHVNRHIQLLGEAGETVIQIR